MRVKHETAGVGRESMCVRRCHLLRGLSVDFSALPDKNNNIIIDFVTVLCTRLLTDGSRARAIAYNYYLGIGGIADDDNTY